MLRHALRALAAQPAVSAGIILSLALAVGANTTIFGLADEILWKPLPVRAPERIGVIYGVKTADASYVPNSYLDYQDYRDGTQALAAPLPSSQRRTLHAPPTPSGLNVFSTLAAYLRLPLRLEQRDAPAAAISAELVSAGYFDAMGVTPVQGRTLVADDEATRQPVAVVSERLWRRQLGADPRAVGSPIVVNGVPVTIVGIVPAEYKGVQLDWTDPPDVWLPLSLIERTHAFARGSGLFTRRDARGFMIVGRLRDGVTHGEAHAAVRTIASRLEAAHPDTNTRQSAAVLPANEARFWPGFRPTITRTLLMFGGAVGLVLLLACTNIANLLLERAAARRKEIAIRLALGATRGSLVRQLMTESVLLAIGGALVGLAFASVLGTTLTSATQLFNIRLALDLQLDWRVLAFTVLLALITAVLFGLMPALRASKGDLVPALKGTQGTSDAGGGLFSLRHGLVIAQVAMSLVLLVCGGLFARSLYESYRRDPGFRSDGLLVMPIDLSGRDDARREAGSDTPTSGRNRALVLDAIDRIAALPGVESVAMGNDPPFGPVRLRLTLTAGGSTEPVSGESKEVGAEYFRTAGIPLIAGRPIETRDLAAGMKTVVINDTLARRLFGTAPAIGRTIRQVTPKGPSPETWDVVGVVKTTKYHSVWEDPIPVIYRPHQRPRMGGATLLIRTRVAAASLAPALRDAISRLDPAVPAPTIETWTDQIAQATAPQRIAANLLGLFSVSALVLAAVGLYSVLAYAVAQRTKEIGLRIALGAEPARVRRQVVGRGLLLSAIGLTIGLGAAALIGPLFAALVPGVTTTDPITLGAVSAVLLLVAAIASVRPARRASRVDPLIAIRSE